MRARPLLAVVIAAASMLVVHTAGAAAPDLASVTGLTAVAHDRVVTLSWDPADYPGGSTDRAVTVTRDGTPVATLPADAVTFEDSPGLAATREYAVVTAATWRHRTLTSPPALVSVRLPAYFVGGATRDITPGGPTNIGGFGLGDGTVADNPVFSRGGQWTPPGGQPAPTDLIRSRALVVDDGTSTVAIADIETQGMFAVYEAGPYGLHDMAQQVSADTGIPVGNILIASDHTHHGPDTIGAWGGVSTDYLAYIKQQTVAAIEAAYADRQYADLRIGESDASGLVYNQSCSEALNQDKEPTYPDEFPPACATPGKDGVMRVLQASAPSGAAVVTLVVFAAHSTTNIGPGMDGDWPQFLGDDMARRFGGVGIGMEGANGGTQPCRPNCSFTSPDEPSWTAPEGTSRMVSILANYNRHVDDALANSTPVSGSVAGAQTFIREPIVGPAVTALFLGGQHIGARLMRSSDSPWMVGNTIRTVVGVIRIGNVLFNGTPGEGFPAIRTGVDDAVAAAGGGPEPVVIQLGLANDQLGYLIAPATYVPVIAAEVPVNDNIIFNVSPTIGDHVMCADIALAHAVAGTDWAVTDPAECAPYDTADTAQATAGDPVSQVPVGGVRLP